MIAMLSELRGGFSVRRVGAMVLRYTYLLRSSWPRIADLVYWPAVQMVTWGFIQTYVSQVGPGQAPAGRLAVGAGTLIGAVLLWDILFRGQLGFSMSFLEEMYSRNVGNLLMSPLRPLELVASLTVMSLIRLTLGVIPVTLMAIVFFGFNLWGVGLGLGAFFANLLLTSWAIGLVICGLLLRLGLGAEALAWSMMFLLMPLACVYYPLSVLPGWLQPIALVLPPTYVFEGLRSAIVQHEFRADLMLTAFGINLVYFAVSVAVFLKLLNSARRAGTLLQMGE